MALTQEQAALFEQNRYIARSRFQENTYLTARRDGWYRLMQRLQPIEVEEEMKKWGDTIDIETPDLEHFVNEHVKIMGLGSIDVATVCHDENEDARHDVEDAETWLRAWYFQLANGDWLNSVMSRPQTTIGVSILRFLYNNPAEPENKYEKERDDHYRFGSHNEFGLQDVNPLELCWGPKLDDPDVIYHECDLPYWEAKHLQNQDGHYLSLDELGKVAWIGDPEPVDQDSADNLNDAAPRVRVVYLAYRDPGSTQWHMCEYVCGQNADMATDGSMMNERLCPPGVTPYIIIPSGDVNEAATDPHWHYRPGLMMRSYVAAADVNYYSNVIARLAVKEAGDFYIYVDTYDLSPEKMSVLEELGVVDGMGQQRRLTFRQPDPAPGEYEISPRLRRKPESVKEALYLLYDDAKKALQASAPSRFLSGEIPIDESKGAPATTVVNQTQAAQFRYDSYAKRRQTAMVQILENCRNCVIAWEDGAGEELDDEGKPKPKTDKEKDDAQKPYYLPVTDAYLQATPDPKSNTWVNARKLKRHFSILVNITNETQQERLLRYQMADSDYQMGLIDFREWLRRRDIRDVEKKIRELNRERLRVASAATYEQEEQLALQVQRSAATGLNLIRPPAPPMQGQPGQQAAPQQLQPPNQLVQGDAAGAGDRLGGPGNTPGIGIGGYGT